MITLRVAVYYSNDDVRIEEMPIPQIGMDELLLKVMACGICGSDVLEWYRRRKAPLVLGHEATGQVVQVGENVKHYQNGDRIFVSHHVPCGECHYCVNDHITACETLHTTNYDPGGFAEYLRVPSLNVQSGIYALPEDVSYDVGTFIEPLGCVIRGQRLADIRAEHTVVILGCGVSGLLHVQLARAIGVNRIIATDVNSYRIHSAEQFGAHVVLHANDINPDRIRELNQGQLADRIVVCTGSESASKQALQLVDRGGTILFFAVPEHDLKMPLRTFWRNEISLKTSYGADPSDLQKALAYITHHRVNIREMITHRIPLIKAAKGFQLVANAKNSLKVIIKPHEM
jgi:L-iditol 2-dehydrogenase